MGLLVNLILRWFKYLFLFSLYLITLLAFLVYAPFLLDLKTQPFKTSLPQAFEGPYRPNDLLSQTKHLFEGDILGPESVVQYKGDIYTGVSDGRILRVRGGKFATVAQLSDGQCQGVWEMEKCGRPLGLRVDAKGQFYVADAYFGVKKIDIASGTGKVTPVFDYKANPADGKAPIFIDDVVLDEGAAVNGGHVLYMSESSTRWAFDYLAYIIIEHECTGRLLKYDTDSKKTTVLVKDICFINGVEISDAKDAIIYVEMLLKRIMRHYIKGPKAGQTEVLIDRLPGEPDNIRRSAAKKETYWISPFGARNASHPSLLLDRLSDKPMIRKVLGRFCFHLGSGVEWVGNTLNYNPLKDVGYGLKTFYLPVKMTKEYGMIIEVDTKGKVVRTLHSPDASTTALSEVREVIERNQRVLYLGSYYNHYLGKLTLS